ncbi:hypothetical protein GCM10010446_01850 [Streptomyces enissocaesilis]|uniref:Uncharacterized protein n=1 Tax=Streptomyces enissocaesilis TaxID=332589 RepID=A0ABN3WMK1_9ACTN
MGRPFRVPGPAVSGRGVPARPITGPFGSECTPLARPRGNDRTARESFTYGIRRDRHPAPGGRGGPLPAHRFEREEL